MVEGPKPWLVIAVLALAVLGWVSSGAAGPLSPTAKTIAGQPGATIAPSSPLPSSSPVPSSPPSTGTPNAAATLASTALAAARAADVNPDVVYVPRPSATPTQVAQMEQNGTVAPLYTANPAPMGLAYYGLSGTGTGPPTATTLTTTAIQGSVDVEALSGEDLYQAEPDSFSIQMNAVLTDVTLSGTPGYTFWTQDIATYSPSAQSMMLVTNIWSFSNVQLPPNYLYGTSGEFQTDDFSDYSTLGFYYSNYTLQGVTEPFDLTLTMTSGLGWNYVGPPFGLNYTADSVTFGALLGYDDGAVYNFSDLDQVTFNSTSSSTPVSVEAPSPYTASGTQLNPIGLTDDFELVICGPGGGSNVDIGDADVDLGLSYFDADTSGWPEIPAAYSYGGDTGESSSGVSVDYFGSSGSYYGWMTDGPSILTGLWGTGAPAGDGYLTLDESPSNAFNFFTYNGESGFSTPISFEQAFAPSFGVQNPTFYLMPGDYTIFSELADYTTETTQVVVTYGESSLDSIALTRDPEIGVYTPLWAFSNPEVAEFAVFGSGTPSSPYVLDNDQPASFSSNFGLYNDYGYPVFPGVFLDGIYSSVELYEPPSFSADTNDSQPWGDDLPQTNDLQYWFWDVSNIALLNATNISGWFGAMGYSPLYFNSFNVVFYDSSDNLVAGNSFLTESQGLLMYTGLSDDYSDYNTVWGNQFVQIAPPRGCPASSNCVGLVPYDFGLGVEIGEDSDLIYNNLFATPTTAWLLPLNLVTGSSQLYPDNQWNITSEPASTINYLVGGATLSTSPDLYSGFPTIPLTGSIVPGGTTQGGNSWWDQGVALNWDNGAVNTDSTLYDENAPTLLDPLSGYPTYLAAVSSTQYPCNPAVSYSSYVADPVGYYCATYIYGTAGGDNAPLTTITESASFEAEGSLGASWGASICGPSAKPPGGPPPNCGPSAKPPGGVPPGEASSESLWLYTSFTTSATEVNMLLPPNTYSWSIPVSPPGTASETQVGMLTVGGSPGSPSPPTPVVTSFVPGYTETVTESGLPMGSVWWFNVTGRLSLEDTTTGSPSTVNTITDVLPDGTFSYAISGPKGYAIVSGSATGTFTVDNANPPGIQVTFADDLAVSPSATPNPTEVGVAVTVSAGDTGGVGPYTYAWSGSVPSCTVSSETSEAFSCTPTAAGSPTIMLTETDSAGTVATGSFSLTVKAALAVAPSASPNPTAVGVSTTISAGDTGGVGPYTYKWGGTVPGCAVASETSESFSCTPTTAESYTISLTETDSLGSTVPGSFVLMVKVAPAITVSPLQGPVGATGTVTGSGFTPSSGATVTGDGVALTPKGCTVGAFSGTKITTSAGGTFTCTFRVPVVLPGSYTVVGHNLATGTASASQTFKVTLPLITVSPRQGPVGATVTVSGTGFSVSTTLKSLVFDGVSISSCAGGSLLTSSSGSFSCTFSVPSGTSGTIVTATDVGGVTAIGAFTVTTPKITLSPTSGAPGTTVTVSGMGFSVSTTLKSLVFNGVKITSCTSGSLTTTATGTFSCSFKVPSGTPVSTVTVSATDVTGQVATASFKVT